MKRSNKYILSAFAAVAMLSSTSCRDDTFDSFNDNQSEYVKVSFTVAPEAAAISTRGGYEDDKPSAQYNTGNLSDGAQVDMIVYGIYDNEGNLLADYSEGVDAALVGVVGEEGHGPGQTIKKVDKFPCKINITLKRGEEYTIAFWAQSSKAAKYYDTSDLRKVEVIYNEINDSNDDQEKPENHDNSGAEETKKSSTPNNDEFRDAFCRSLTLTAGEGGIEQNVYLYRPLAQINVGTAGYDYEIVTRNANVQYLYSKIRINRVARYLDVVADKTIVNNSIQGDDDSKYDYDHRDTEAFAVVDLGYAPIPAYATMNLDNHGEDIFPPYPSFTVNDWIYNDISKVEAHPKHPDSEDQPMWYKDYEKEQFLKLHLDGSDANDPTIPSGSNSAATRGPGIGNWITNQKKVDEVFYPYANLDNYEGYDSETFKWLSMCYVLTSSSKEDARVINNVKVWVASDAQGTNERELVNIDHVPVQRNWRTNIVGELFTTENDFQIVLDRNFAGDYNLWNNNGSWELSGPLANGVFYDAENDVIEISSKDGLIWFQQMVNGNILVREAPAAYKNMEGDYYKYYDVILNDDGTVKEAQGKQFVYDGINEPSDKALAERILVATHQKWNKNNNGKWPKYNNFHFTATKEMESEMKAAGINNMQATVRLMADIDLSNEEWVPIGFDGRIGEQLGWKINEVASYMQGNTQSQSSKDKTTASNRIFYGIFDGNGHTISNLSTKRFNANVHETAYQEKAYRKVYTTDTRHPADNPQWFGSGLFGQIGGRAKIIDTRLNNVDIKGCNGVAGIAAIAYGDDIEISGCIVDGGKIEAIPMYRGDNYRENRTFARGVYTGGIVGYFNTDGGKVDNNIVRNVTIKGVRRLGCLIGSLNQIYMTADKSVTDEGIGLVDGSFHKQRESRPASIYGNRLENITFIATSFTTYGEKATAPGNPGNDGIARTGFGWNTGNLEMYAQKFVGGYDQDADVRTDIPDMRNIFKNNTESGVVYSPLLISNDTWFRTGEIQTLPLEDMPMLSSWYADYINLHDNYYGAPSANVRVRLTDFMFFTGKTTKKTGYNSDGTFSTNPGYISSGGTNFYYPMAIPELPDISYDKTSPKAGVFVESVVLNGEGGIGGRSVITSTNLMGDDFDCVMYITARNRHQFGYGKYKTGESGNHNLWPDFMKGYESENDKINCYKVPTIVKNVVLRGEPYANNGIVFATNKNMHRVELDNVTIYDVYKTLAMYKWDNIENTPSENNKWWPNQNTKYDVFSDNGRTDLIVSNSNLRGYTVPGKLWNNITYTNTTFEQGANTRHGADEYTYKVEFLNGIYDKNNPKDEELGKAVNGGKTKTTFNHCFFKAPFIIDMTELKDKDRIILSDCWGTAANQTNVKINFTNDLKNKGCDKIYVRVNIQGEPYVEYFKDDELLHTDYIIK